MPDQPVAGQVRNGVAKGTSAYLFLFFLSGFSGLVYESVWSHYLELNLGHAAYAQTLVLCLFLGGMSLGALLASRFAQRIRNPLMAYAIVEAVIGVFALVFHELFLAAHTLLFDQWIPLLENPVSVKTVIAVVSGVLILPQCILLGATFPLMAGAMIGRAPAAGGRLIALLYFCNSLGAAAGVLANTYYLIPELGLPGTSLTAGGINLFVACAVGVLSQRVAGGAARQAAPARSRLVRVTGTSRLLLIVAAMTGMASFVYEIAWIRMLSLVLGSSVHSFELMLCAFIFGLAIGSLFIRTVIQRLASPERTLAYVQVLMGVAALATLALYMPMFEWMQQIMQHLEKTPEGYLKFNAASLGLAMLLMVPVTIFAGMTLPLLTHSLLRREVGQAGIGLVYGWNMLGSIVGAVLALQWLLPVIGLRNTVVFGAMLDLVAGIILLRHYRTGRAPFRWIVAGSISTALVAATLHFAQFAPLRMASGVYRDGVLIAEGTANVVFHADGKTASVDVVDYTNGRRAILTNGKADGSISFGKSATLDESTTTQLAAIPLALHPEPRKVAVIGMGWGQTTDTLLLDPGIVQVDTVEIEEQIIAGARLFGATLQHVFEDSRSHLHVEDAKTFFASRKTRYDIIISEPSGPWVSGVAGLYSVEFYQRIRGKLALHGLYAQWLHLYEISPETVASVFNALMAVFPSCNVYEMVLNDALFVCGDFVPSPVPYADRVLAIPALAQRLARVGIHSPLGLKIREIPGNDLFKQYFLHINPGIHSDYHPSLPYDAIRDRFLNRTTDTFRQHRAGTVPVIQMLSSSPASGYCATPDSAVPTQEAFRQQRIARQIQEDFQRSGANQQSSSSAEHAQQTFGLSNHLLRRLKHCAAGIDYPGLLDQLARIAEKTLPHLTCGESPVIWDIVLQSACMQFLDASARDWPRLYRAIATQDWNLIETLSGRLLRSNWETPENAASVPVHALATVLIRSERPAQAQRLLAEYPDTKPAEQRRMLEALAGRPARE